MTITYTILRINGDYATAQSDRGNTTDIALALLPEDVNEGDIILFQDFEYRKIPKNN